MKNKKIGIAIIAVLCAAFLFSGIMFFRQYTDAKNSQESFEDLAEMITDITPEETDGPEETADEPAETEETEEDPTIREAELAHMKYGAMFDENSDFIGWISIDGTNINYPVMLGEYYLKHNFNKQYSDYGVPFVIGGITDNTIIYGHNMKTRTMFYDLTRYSNPEFYKKHKYIEFSTLDSKSTYEIVCVFKTVAYSNQGFDYTKYSNFNTPDDFNIFTEKCSNLALYDAETSIEYGDKLITLSTCEYSRSNGRFVVVAKEVI